MTAIGIAATYRLTMYKSDQISAVLNIEGYLLTVGGTMAVVSDVLYATNGRNRYDDYR